MISAIVDIVATFQEDVVVELKSLVVLFLVVFFLVVYFFLLLVRRLRTRTKKIINSKAKKISSKLSMNLMP